MTTYSTITDGQVDQDSPITQPLMTALRDNPIAIAEGAAGAPKIAESWRALETTSSNGLIVPDVDLGEGVRAEVTGFGTVQGGTLALKVSISSDNGATFVSEVVIDSVSEPAGDQQASLNTNGTFLFDRPTGAWAFHNKSGNDMVTGTFPSASGVTDIRFRFYIGANGQNDKIAILAFITGGKATA